MRYCQQSGISVCRHSNERMSFARDSIRAMMKEIWEHPLVLSKKKRTFIPITILQVLTEFHLEKVIVIFTRVKLSIFQIWLSVPLCLERLKEFPSVFSPGRWEVESMPPSDVIPTKSTQTQSIRTSGEQQREQVRSMTDGKASMELHSRAYYEYYLFPFVSNLTGEKSFM